MRGFGLLMLVLALALGFTDGRGRLESAVMDQITALNGRPPPPDIAIVGIDDHSLARLGRWPWRRTVHAALIDRLDEAGVQAIGLDIILDEPDTQHPHDDELLAEALRRSGRVVLPVRMAPRAEPGAVWEASRPAPPFAAAAAALGHIHVELDPDGVARSVFLREGGGGQWWDHFAQVLRSVAGWTRPGEALPGIRRPDGAAPAWARDHWWQVPFSGPPGHVARWSYVDVLEGRVPAGALQGKVVLVGATAVGMGDAYPTPMASQHALMPGVEISANVLDALQRGLSLRRAEPWENAMASALMMALALVALRWLQPRAALASIGLLMPAVLVAAWLAHRHAGVQFAPLTGLLALALAYPLWSWRRLEAAMRYLAQEFDRTQRAAPEASGHASAFKPAAGDALDHRMRAMAEAAERLRALQREQEEAWRFISHDMRAPQASILTLIEGQRSQGRVDADMATWLDRIEDHARRTLALAEDYVHLARVRSGGVRGQVALNDVLFDAVDQQWALAAARQVRLSSEVPEQLCVAHADGLLLTRALVNLIDNAIKFSPPHGAVRCTLACRDGMAVFTVSDEGPGLAPEAQSALFKPFGMAASATSSALPPDGLASPAVVQGAGLGLSFVRSVADCHGGRVGVRSMPGQGAAFWLSLPVLAHASSSDVPLSD